MPKADKYEIQHRRNLLIIARKIQQIYSDAIEQLAVYAATLNFRGTKFNLSLYPELQRRVNLILEQMRTDITSVIVNSVKQSWELSNIKNDALVNKQLGGRIPKDRVRRLLYDPNQAALDRFLARREKGLNLSERVWKVVKPFGGMLEAGLGLGIAEGQPAKTIAKDLKKYLQEPDRLYRRVRDNQGKLRLSKAAAAYHPGQGVYRSSAKNAERIGRTETNMAYRSSDLERWKNMPFVIGYEIRLSANHPKYDICDVLAGRYPKEFSWVGWHPNCICYIVPILMPKELYDLYENYLLGLGGFDMSSIPYIKDVPKEFKQYVKANRKRIEGWKNKPYWMKDNPTYV
jgi:hypothetical protein